MATGQVCQPRKRSPRFRPFVAFAYRCGWVWCNTYFEAVVVATNPDIAARALVINWLVLFLGCLAFSRGLLGQRVIANDPSPDLASEGTDVVEKGLLHVGRKNLSPLRRIASYEMKVLDFVEHHHTKSLLGICGMRGVGKTTLLRFLRDYSSSYYATRGSYYVFFVGAGTGCTVDRLQHVLLVNIYGLAPPPQSSDAAKVISSFLKGKPFLLLLDDVREWLDLAAVGLPMPLGRRQKVIFTTRNQAICTDMGCASCDAIQMECLDEADAWSLFKDEVGDEIIEAHPHIEHLANKMAAECRGLPSALCNLGRAMATKRDVKEWRHAYHTIEREQLPRANEIDTSYDMLERIQKRSQNHGDKKDLQAYPPPFWAIERAARDQGARASEDPYFHGRPRWSRWPRWPRG